MERSMRKKRKGFTIIELVMVISIAGILFGILAPIMKTTIDAYFFVNSREAVLSDARLAMNRMVREIRQIKEPSDISTMNSSEIQFTDINDNVVNFRQSGTSLQRNGNVLAEDLKSSGGLIFTYLDSYGNQTTTASYVRTIEIELVIQDATGDLVIKSQGNIRNT